MGYMANTKSFRIAVVGIIATAAFASPTLAKRSSAAPAGPHHSFLGGPWEIVVKTRLDDEGLRFPLTVSDETRPQKLDIILPVEGTPIEIRIEDYVPDLKWETNAVKYPGQEIAAKLLIEGTNLKQDIWLSSGDPARQSISSRIGSITIKRLHNNNNAEKLMRGLAHPGAVGILTFWTEEGKPPFECVAKVSETIRVPGSRYKVNILKYLPHYSIDTETKMVVNQSQKPVNPTVKVAINDGGKTSEHWLWAKFPTTPHKEKKLPLRMRFTDFDLGGTSGKYILAVAGETKQWLLSYNKDKKNIERAVLGRSYPFADREFSFTIEKIIDGAIVKTDWVNGSERLLHPAVITTIKENGVSNQVVLELNKPVHKKMKSGMLVMLYRRTQAS